jgi:hypothetical protein
MGSHTKETAARLIEVTSRSIAKKRRAAEYLLQRIVDDPGPAEALLDEIEKRRGSMPRRILEAAARLRAAIGLRPTD